MFFPSDPFSEIVVHFLGYFELAVEDMRIRLQLEEFERASEDIPENPEATQFSAEVTQTYTIGNFLPGVSYSPPDWIIRGDAPLERIHVGLNLPRISIEIGDNDIRVPGAPEAPAAPPVPFVGPEPGAMGAVISQMIVLSDNDVFSMNALEAPIVFNSYAAQAIATMDAAGSQVLGAVATGMGLQSHLDIARLVDKVSTAASEQGQSPATEVHSVEALSGTYINGAAAADAPTLDDLLPEHLRAEDSENTADRIIEDSGEATAQVIIVGDETQGTVTLQSGGNFLVNDAAVLNAGLVSTQFVVGGDFHQLDAIFQVNVYSDLDAVDARIPLALAAPDMTTAINVATFTQETRETGGAADANPGVMPLNWQVTVVTGDLIFIEWMKQLTLMSDQDIAVLTATGSNVTVTSGENLANNEITLQNIGLYYDLIIVGGDVYDVNIIIQTNILYDNDTIAMLGETMDGLGAQGMVDTSGNLLFNQASIHNVGATAVEEGISEPYQDAMDGLGRGDHSMPESFKSADAFEGTAVPRVLYVTGSIFDLRYIEQTNIAGDADLVALQASGFAESQPETRFDIETGANALVNIATIKDFDTYGDTIQVGGEHYSDAVLIQAEILASSETGQPDALVTEVVAFLDNSDDVVGLPDHDFHDAIPDGAHLDVMQSVLA